MLLQSNFPFPVLNRKTIFWKKKSYFLRLLFAFTKSFVFNDGQITECEKKSSWGDESPMGLHCLKKHLLLTNFHWQQKREVNNFFDGKRIWKTRG